MFLKYKGADKFLKYIVISLLLLEMMNAANAVMIEGEEFLLKIQDVKVNLSKLLDMCTPESCIVGNNSITIRSYYDERVAVEIGDSWINIKLPFRYENTSEGLQIISEIDPKKYNWRECVRTDLLFLKIIGVLNITDSEVEEISKLAEGGSKILYCGGKWRRVGLTCYCHERCMDDRCKVGIVCLEASVRPAGASKFSIPQKSLGSIYNFTLPESPSSNASNVRTILIIFSVLVAIFLLVVLLRKK